MDEKLLRVICLMVQLRSAMKECDGLISCELRDEFCSVETGNIDGIKADIQFSGSCGINFPNVKPFDQRYDEHYTIVNGVEVFCLMDKEDKYESL